MARIKIWDLPTRLFHWLLVLSVAGAFITESLDEMEWHGRVGLFVLGLLVFRLIWGFVGSTYARFTQFIRGPQSIRAYLKGEWKGLGHNPIGALSVLALLGTLGLQVGTGLFANDDGSFYGPLARLVSEGVSGNLTELHEAMEPVLIVLLCLHIAAIFFYAHVKKDNLVKPMLTGWKEAEGEAARGGGLVPFLIAVGLAAGAVYLASGALLPPPPEALVTPNW